MSRIPERESRFLAGVDEAGRGPLAGPIAVGAIFIKESALVKFRGILDSKKLSKAQRERWFSAIKAERKLGNLDFRVAFVGNKFIDEFGISRAAKLAISRALSRLNLPDSTRILLDGLLFAPPRFIFQETVVRGDEIHRVIAMASIVAKVCRDKKMNRLSKKFPEYQLDKHKGYGTEFHRNTIRKNGVSPIHRISFLRGF